MKEKVGVIRQNTTFLCPGCGSVFPFLAGFYDRHAIDCYYRCFVCFNKSLDASLERKKIEVGALKINIKKE